MSENNLSLNIHRNVVIKIKRGLENTKGARERAGRGGTTTSGKFKVEYSRKYKSF